VTSALVGESPLSRLWVVCKIAAMWERPFSRRAALRRVHYRRAHSPRRLLARPGLGRDRRAAAGLLRLGLLL